MSGRIESIQAMLSKAPNDLFLHYSLGMEYAAGNRWEDAMAQFGFCIKLDANYLPAYVEAGKAMRNAGKLDKAREVFQAALSLAEILKQEHTANFIKQQLEGLPILETK